MSNSEECVQRDSPNISYTPRYYNIEKSNEILSRLLKCVTFDDSRPKIQGRTYKLLRKAYAYADPNIYYHFSGSAIRPRPWTSHLQEIKSELETFTKHEFNYVLINLYESGHAMVRAHKEEEVELDSHIAILTFGAERTIIFSKVGERSVSHTLQHGCLLQMHNQQWFHEIPRDISIEKPHISLSFRKVNMSAAKYRPHTFSEPIFLLQPPVKKIHTTPQYEWLKEEEDWLIDFENNYSICSMSNQKMTPATSLRSCDIARFCLSAEVDVCVRLYKGEISIHIRKYYRKSGNPIPTKNGVCMNIPTFYELGCKVSTFCHSLKYTSESTIINNTLLVKIENRFLCLQSFSDRVIYPHKIYLDIDMVDMLRRHLPSINKSITEYIFCEQLKYRVCTYESPEYASSAFQALKNVVENNLAIKLRELHVCQGCVKGTFTQKDHSCDTITHSEMYRHLSPSIIMLCDIDKVAEQYLHTHKKLAYSFDFTDLYKNLFTK